LSKKPAELFIRFPFMFGSQNEFMFALSELMERMDFLLVGNSKQSAG